MQQKTIFGPTISKGIPLLVIICFFLIAGVHAHPAPYVTLYGNVSQQSGSPANGASYNIVVYDDNDYTVLSNVSGIVGDIVPDMIYESQNTPNSVGDIFNVTVVLSSETGKWSHVITSEEYEETIVHMPGMTLQGIQNGESPSPSSGGGGGGGGGGGSCNTFTFTKISKDENGKAQFTGDECKGFPYVSVTPREDLSYTKLTVNLYDKKPWDTMADPPKGAYRYLYLRFSKPDTYIKKGVIEFSINKTWMKENDVDPYSVSVYRFVDNNWEEIETGPIIDNGTNIIFSAVTPGFSYFVITGELKSGFRSLSSGTGKVQSGEKGSKEESTESALMETSSSTPATHKPKAEEIIKTDTGAGEGRVPSAVIGQVFQFAREGLPIAGVFSLIGGILYYTVKRKARKGPAGKRETPEEERPKPLLDLKKMQIQKEPDGKI